MELIDRIERREIDPSALLLYGPDLDQLDDYAERLIRSWLGVGIDRDLGRHVDFQRFDPGGAGQQIRLSVVHRVKNSEEEVTWVPIVEFFRTMPMMGSKKVVWIRGVHRMNGDAANGFLKILEELAPHAGVVLTTPEFSRVLPTIRSRCLCVACGVESHELVGVNSDMERAWGKSLGDLRMIRDHSAIFGEYWDLLESAPGLPMGAVVWLSERSILLAKRLAEAQKIHVRNSQIILLDFLGRWVFAQQPEWADVATECSAVAREISGYSNGQLGFDTLFGMMLEKTREPVSGGVK